MKSDIWRKIAHLKHGIRLFLLSVMFLWGCTSEEEPGSEPFGPAEFVSIAFSPDGQTLFGNTGKEVAIWNLQQTKTPYVLPGSFFAAANDSRTFLTRSANGFRAWKTDSCDELPLDAIDPQQYGRYKRSWLQQDVAQKTFIIHDALNVHVPLRVAFAHIEDVVAARLSPDGACLAIGLHLSDQGWEHTKGVCLGLDGATRFEFSYQYPLYSQHGWLYLAEDHPFLASVENPAEIGVYDWIRQRLVKTVAYESGGGNFLRIGPQRELTIAVHRDLTSVQILPPPVRNGVITEKAAVLDAAFHPDGQRLACVVTGGSIQIYQLKTLKLERTIRAKNVLRPAPPESPYPTPSPIPPPPATPPSGLYPTMELPIQPQRPIAPINLPEQPTAPPKFSGDLAWNQPTFASSYYEDGYPARCTSGQGAWRSAESSGAWVYVDLGEPKRIHHIVTTLFVDANRSKSPRTTYIASNDMRIWERVIEETNVDNVSKRGQPRTLTLPHDVTARYVGLYAAGWDGGWADMGVFAVLPGQE